MGEDIHWQKYTSRFKTFPSILKTPPSDNVGMVVCIPVYAEPDLIPTLVSISHCELPDTGVEVILLFNKSDRMTIEEIRLHERGWELCLEWIQLHPCPGLKFHPVYVDAFPDPRGGVGWARKFVLDEAARRLDQDGIMVCLDGDCLVEKNYLKVIYSYFQKNPPCDAASVYYEHLLDQLGTYEREAIVQYELHLRYLVHAMHWAGHPFSFQTVGSSMAVRRKAYMAHGGMNTREAGEDFYFLQKFIEIDSLHEITDTAVYPSARISHRVPFGTGRAMKQLLAEPSDWMTTTMESFSQIRILFNQLDIIRNFSMTEKNELKDIDMSARAGLPSELTEYLLSIDFYTECRKIAKQTASVLTFRRRFFRYFNAFRMIRYTHYMRDHFFSDIPVTQAAAALLASMQLPNAYNNTTEAYLQMFRSWDKGGKMSR
jgi:hypothetical protein